jgi:RNA polymerase sigma-B factor
LDTPTRSAPRNTPAAAALSKPQKDLEAKLLRRYASSPTPALRDELVRRFMPLARALAARYRSQTEDREDLVQVASLGLLKAIDGFDPERGRPFTAYAVPTILGELRRHFRDHVGNLRLPRGLQELTMKVEKASAELTEREGRYPTPAQIAELLGIPIEEVLEGLQAGQARSTLSLDAPRGDDEESAPVVETLGKHDADLDGVEARMAAAEVELDDRERMILRLRFEEELTQKEIGDELGVSQMQISRISRAALWKLLAGVRGEQAEKPVPAMRRQGSRRT